MPTGSFGFAFDPAYRLAGLPLGITPRTARLDLEYGELSVRFGPWSLRTPLSNVTSTSVTGPYGHLKTIGPPHLSLSDRGVTFATNAASGLCICFEEPVPAIDPMGWIRHPAMTVTVDDVAGLQTALAAA